MFRWAVRLARRALGTVLLFVLLLCGAEVAVRLLELRSGAALAPKTVSLWDSLTVPSWTVRQELRPLASLRVRSTRSASGHAIRTNSFGLRGAEVEVPKPPAVYRVVCLGDESILGAALPENELLTAHLQRRLQEQTRLTIEVCNAGLPGASLLTEYLLLTRRLAPLQPDLIVVAVDESDVVDDLQHRRYARFDERGVPLTCRHPSLHRTPRADPLGPWRQQFRLVDLALHWAGDAWKRNSGLDGDVDLAGPLADRTVVERALQPLPLLAAWCRLNAAPLCVFRVASAPEQTPAAESLFETTLRELASSQQFVLVEAHPPGEVAAGTAWSADAHREFAGQLAERLVSDVAGPWNSPYFRPVPPEVAPASLEVSESARGDRR
jgi:hypothetical protein